MSILVKICGLCRPEDVDAAIEAGADMLGFVLYGRSPRYVSLDLLSRLTESIPSDVLKVGVVVNAEPAAVTEAVEVGNLDVIQFHGDESQHAIERFTLTACWKAVSLQSSADVDLAAQCPADKVLVDAISPNARGGTGKRCNWDLAGQLAQRRSIILAGGLQPENVAEAIRTVRPYAVDVSSGVEKTPGQKDHAAVRAFVRNARRAIEDDQPPELAKQPAETSRRCR